MPMQAIADDSGCKGQGPNIVFAGLIGRSEWWADFSDQWAACLIQPPKIDYFKMYEAAHRVEQFAHFSETARNEKLIALVRIMNDHPFTALHVTMDLAAHERMFPRAKNTAAPKRKPNKGFLRAQAVALNPYFYAYNLFISAACFHLWEAGEREKFEFIVDEHPSLGALTKLWYPAVRVVMREPERAIMPVDPITRNDEEFMPLQAADMIAWLQRAENSDEGHEFAWLDEHFTAVEKSPRCLYAGDAWFAGLRELRKTMPKSLPIEAMIEIAILEGAPIARPKGDS